MGVVEVTSVDVVAGEPSVRDARRAGFDTLEALQKASSGRSGTLYRVGLRYFGEDPRIALRNKATMTPAEASEIAARLDAMDARSKIGRWTRRTLRLIADNEATRAPDLAVAEGRETKPFKASVRRLKELGLTESLEVGYRISPRGRAFLRLDPAARDVPSRRRK